MRDTLPTENESAGRFGILFEHLRLVYAILVHKTCVLETGAEGSRQFRRVERPRQESTGNQE